MDSLSLNFNPVRTYKKEWRKKKIQQGWLGTNLLIKVSVGLQDFDYEELSNYNYLRRYSLYFQLEKLLVLVRMYVGQVLDIL